MAGQSLHRTSEKQEISVYGYGTSLVGNCLEVLVINDSEDAGYLLHLVLSSFYYQHRRYCQHYL